MSLAATRVTIPSNGQLKWLHPRARCLMDGVSIWRQTSGVRRQPSSFTFAINMWSSCSSGTICGLTGLKWISPLKIRKWSHKCSAAWFSWRRQWELHLRLIVMVRSRCLDQVMMKIYLTRYRMCGSRARTETMDSVPIQAIVSIIQSVETIRYAIQTAREMDVTIPTAKMTHAVPK